MPWVAPTYLDSPQAILTSHGEALTACIGRTIEAAWIAWDVEDDEWFRDEAVILNFGGCWLAVNCWKLDEMALEWGQIDFAARPSWVAEWGSEFSLEWRPTGLPELQQALGRQVIGINVLEYSFETTVVESKDVLAIGTQHQAWLLHGLEFALGDATLTIFNALDQNGVTLEPSLGPEYRRTPVPAGRLTSQ